MKNVLLTFGKILFGGLAFYAGIVLGGMLSLLLGLPLPSMPEGVDSSTLLYVTLSTSVLLAGALAFVSARLGGGFLARWLILTFLVWIAYGVNTYLEASIFTTMTGPSFVIIYLVAGLVCSALMAAWFRPADAGDGFPARARRFFSARPASNWTWRLAAAYLAFPAAYLFFGTLVQPFTLRYYQQGMFNLTAPGWGTILPILAFRSLLFVLATLPVLITWTESRASLFFTLGLVLFLLVGGLGLLQAVWYPPVIRIAHSVEILADSLMQSAGLVFLLVNKERNS